MAETQFVATATTLVQQATYSAVATLARRADDTTAKSSQSQIDINASYLFDPANAPGTGPYFSANNIDAATQITSAALMGGCCIGVFSFLRYKWPELYSHRLRLRYMRPANIPRTMFGWIYPMVTMSDRHIFETVGLDALLFFRSYRMMIYVFIWLAVLGMSVLYPVDWYWGEEDGDKGEHSVFESPIASVTSLNGRYSVPHVLMAYVFAVILFFYIDRFSLHMVTMRWHYLLLTRRSGNSRTLMVTHLPRELRSESALQGFINGMHVGEVESVHVAPMTRNLDGALAHRAAVLVKLEAAYTAILGNPCRAHSYNAALLKRVILSDDPKARAVEARLLHRWAKHSRRSKDGKRYSERPTVLVKRTRAERPDWSAVRAAVWPYERTDAINYYRSQMTEADRRLKEVRDNFHQLEASPVAFVTMKRPVNAYILAQLNVYAAPNTCKIRMAPEARSIVWKSVGAPYSKKILRYILGLLMSFALLCLWCVPVVLISTLISLQFLVTRFPTLASVVQTNKFVRSLLNYTLPSLILTIFMTILPRLLWMFVLVGGDRAYGIADKNMLIRHFYFLVVYMVFIVGMSGTVWSSIYEIFTEFGEFWSRLVGSLPQLSTWFCVYVMLYGAGYQVMKLLHLKSVCRFLWHQANARTPRQYMKAISPVFIDWGTIAPYPMLFFFIGLLYSHLQPLLLAMCILYFSVGLFVMKYMCTYAWYFRQQAAASFWPVIIRRWVFCILLYQVLTTAIFASNDNHWFAAPMAVLMLFTLYYFLVRCRYIRQLSDSVPLQLLREAERRRKVTLAKEQREFEENERKAERDLAINGRDSSGTGGISVGWADLNDRRMSTNSDESASTAMRVPALSVLTQPNSIASRLTSGEGDADANIDDDNDIDGDNEKIERDGSASPQFMRAREATVPLVPPGMGNGGGGIGDIGDVNGSANSNAAEGDALITQRKHPKRTKKWYQLTVINAILHPIQALIATVSFSSTWINGDPAAPLWDFIDDYAFPERVPRIAHPAGRSPMDPHKPKEQPGSLAEILALAVRRIPHGLRIISREFFMDFDIPKAYLDSSVFDYPMSTSNDDAFSVRHRRRRSTHKKRVHENVTSDSDDASANDSLLSGHYHHDLCPHAMPANKVVRLRSDSDADKATPRPHSGTGVRIHRAHTFMPNADPVTGKPVAMQFQIHADELPHGTLMNRRFTDFSQPNMSRLPGVLDSTRFSYLHPGMYGDLPSLWLPVAHLKRRKQEQQYRSPGDRLHRTMAGFADAVEANIIGEKNVEKLHQRHERARDKWAARVRHPRVSALNTSPPESQMASPAASDSEAASPPPISRRLADKCSALGFDASILRQCDPTGLHGLDLARQPTAESTISSVYNSDAATDYDAIPNPDDLSGSESDNMDESASQLSAALRGLSPPVHDPSRGMEEGRTS